MVCPLSPWRAWRDNSQQHRPLSPCRAGTFPPIAMTRQDLLASLRSSDCLDLVVVGGGATGLGVALDAALRGFSVALFEANDFASGTSSRSTKLLHGG